MRKINKRGQVGLDVAKSVILTLMTIGVLAFAVIVAMSALNNSNALTAGSLEQQQTTAVLQNISGGTSSFFGNVGTWFALLAVVVIILIIAIVIIAVNRFGGRGGM